MAGGWNPQQVQRYKTVALPEKLKCMGCQSTQPISNFTETQMNRLRKKLATQGQTALLCHTARCLSCTGGLRPTEITCIGCKVTKPLEAYSKVQRIEWDNARCKSCIGTSLMAVSWTEHCEKVSAKEYSDDISDIASTINESEGGVRLPAPSIFPVLSKPRPTMFPESQEKLGGGVWIECSSVTSPDDDTVDDTMSTTSTATRISANTLGASSAAKYSGWNFSALKEDNHRPTLPGAKPQSKAWAKIKSADPARDARILRRSDPMWSPEQDENTASEPSLGSMVAGRDKSKLHKEITEENNY